MFTLKRLIGGSLFVFVLAGTALAQENRAPIDTPREPVAPASAAPLVTAAATAKRVRFVSPGTVVQLRLEVYNESGQKLFDTELHGGNVLDWHLQDGAGQRLQTGSYACVLTIKSLSGRLSQRVGLVTVNDKKAALEAAGAAQLSTAQQQTIGPVEGNAAFTILQESEAEAITAVTHDGTEGQVARTRGALSFRVGDFFSGKDKEQMRLTEEGNLGIGTSKPRVKLDVAGMIRAREGLMFSDGSTLKINEKGVLTRTSADGASPNAVTSTQNKIAKFTDNVGTVGDSVITESVSGFIGIGTPNPGALLDVSDDTNHLKYSPTTGKLTLTGPASNLTVNPGLRLEFNSDPDAGLSYLAYSHDNISQAYDAYWNGAAWVSSHLGANFAIYKNASQLAIGFNAGTPKGSTFPAFDTTTGVIFSKTGTMGIGGAPGNAKLYVNGNVGIGTNNPAHKLDVAGNINTSTQFNIGGLRVLSAPGVNNTFAGVSAGATNMGLGNAFFGTNAGLNNTASVNSFFGSGAGRNNNTGAANSFFGDEAGFNNNTGGSNAFFGYQTGFSNQGGCCNSFFGTNAGHNNTGSSNSFFGYSAGLSNTTESNNTFIGSSANGATGITNATAIGYLAKVTQSNSLVLGSISGENDATSNTNVGIGTTAPQAKLDIQGGADAGGTTDVSPALAFSWRGGGFRHWLRTRHSASASADNAIDFFVNNSTTAGGSTAPGTGSQHVMSLDGGKVGIGVATPKSKLQVTNGDIFVNTIGTGLIIKSANGSCFRIIVSDGGVLSALVTPCPDI